MRTGRRTKESIHVYRGGGGTRMCKKLKNFSCDGIKGLVRGNDTRKGLSLFRKKKRPTGMPPPQARPPHSKTCDAAGGSFMKTSGKLSEFLNGAGFYIVLFLAIAIIGASGYFIYTTLFGDRESPDASSSGGNAIVSEQPEHQMPDVELHEDVTLPQSEPDRETVSVSSTVPVEAPTDEAASADTRIVAPLSGDTLTPFSMDALLYNATMNDWRTHNGVDISAQEGDAVSAAASGKVLSVVEDYWLGTTVTISCADGYELTYGSLQTVDVSAGQQVNAGDTIGSAGMTALLEEALGPHLHFSVVKDGVAVDPAVYLKQGT